LEVWETEFLLKELFGFQINLDPNFKIPLTLGTSQLRQEKGPKKAFPDPGRGFWTLGFRGTVKGRVSQTFQPINWELRNSTYRGGILRLIGGYKIGGSAELNWFGGKSRVRTNSLFGFGIGGEAPDAPRKFVSLETIGQKG